MNSTDDVFNAQGKLGKRQRAELKKQSRKSGTSPNGVQAGGKHSCVASKISRSKELRAAKRSAKQAAFAAAKGSGAQSATADPTPKKKKAKATKAG